jgi:glycosyltransferase involved in cell wall biosynthesis
MVILYFYQYFSTPKGSWGTRVYEFGKDWVSKGHRVIVVTSVYSKSDVTTSKFIDTQFFEGIEVKVVNITIDNKLSFLNRLIGFAVYSLVASYYALTIKCDRVIASSGPITVAIPGLLAKFVRRRKLVFEVRDLWPQGAIELGYLKNTILRSLAFWLERITYFKSDLIVGLSPGMVQNINRRFNLPIKVISITNSVDTKLFSETKLVSHPNVSFKYAIYTGNIGPVNNTFLLVDAARELKKREIKDLKIWIIGDGQLKNEIRECIENENLDTLILSDLMPKYELVPVIQNALVSVIPLVGSPVLDTSSPNKLFESMGAGLYIIQNTKGWIRDFLEANCAGVTIDPNDHVSLVNEIVRLSQLTGEERLRIKENALRVSQQFDKTNLSSKMLNAILEL